MSNANIDRLSAMETDRLAIGTVFLWRVVTLAYWSARYPTT